MIPTIKHGICIALLPLTLFVALIPLESAQSTYTLPVRVDEVNLVFTASDFEGRPLADLTLSDMQLFDNGKRQTKIVKFEHRTEQPLRAGILVDISGSMAGESNSTKSTVALFAEHILRSNTDQAFVMRFASMQKLMQDWTNNVDELRAASPQIGWNTSTLGLSTALFDSIYIALRNQFENNPSNTRDTANVILLFSDGVDDASHARLEDVMDICQQTNSKIYAFYYGPESHFAQGEKNLRSLATGTGGRFFYNNDAAHALSNLRSIESELRNNYLIAYKPSHLKDDGKFHSIRLTSPTRGGVMTTRSGYYAPRASK